MENDAQGDVRYRVLSVRAIVAWAVLTVLAGVGLAVWLLLAYTSGDTEANRVQLDAIRTAGTVVVGAGGAAALLLAARRQRSTEIALRQKDRDQADVARAHALQERIAAETRAHQERVAIATEADAEARRITDLYTKAVEQLGSDKAPVRLGGLYALERLAQDHVEQRQTIVNVLCAYLRMPFTPPAGQAPAADADKEVKLDYQQRVQEREVRLTAQRLLADHLQPRDHAGKPLRTFWANIDLNLTGATLIDFALTRCTLGTANFDSATFTGTANFGSATFTGTANFGSATFTGFANFGSATFTGFANFGSATFTSDAYFRSATFTSDAYFRSATFTSDAYFRSATFTSDAYFRSATFTGFANFGSATFTSDANFRSATFTSDAYFRSATFTGIADFGSATFTRGVPKEVERFWSPGGESHSDALPMQPNKPTGQSPQSL